MFSAFTPQDWVAAAIVGLLAVVAGAVLVWLAVGLFNARSLIRRELSAYFLSPTAYVVLVVFLLVTGFLFFLTMNQLTAVGPKGVEFPMQFMLGDRWYFWLVFVIIPPLLTMRLFAEERATGTLEMLMTAPVREWQIVLSKYLACFAFYLFMWVPTLVYLPVLLDMGTPAFEPVLTVYSLLFLGGVGGIVVSLLLAFLPGSTSLRLIALVLFLVGCGCTGVGAWGHWQFDPEPRLLTLPIGIDPMPVLASYLGLALTGAMFLAIGILVSSLVRSQMVAALVSLVLGLVFIAGGPWLPEMDAGSEVYRGLYFFSIPLHFDRDFSRGLLDTRHLVLYGSVAVFCLFLTVRSLESRRWR